MGKIIHITYQDIVYERPLKIFSLKHCTVGLGIRRCMHTSVTKGFKKKGKTEDKKEADIDAQWLHSKSSCKYYYNSRVTCLRPTRKCLTCRKGNYSFKGEKAQILTNISYIEEQNKTRTSFWYTVLRLTYLLWLEIMPLTNLVTKRCRITQWPSVETQVIHTADLYARFTACIHV